MRRSTPLTSEERAKVLELHAAGKGRNDIAREVGVALATVTKIVHGEGLTFDRTATKAATEAAKADARARRSELSAALLEDAHRLREQLWQPTKIYNFGGKDNTYIERNVDQPPFESQLKIVQAAGSALTKHLDIERHDADTHAAAARSMLLAIGEALGVQKPDA